MLILTFNERKATLRYATFESDSSKFEKLRVFYNKKIIDIEARARNFILKSKYKRSRQTSMH